VNINKDLRGFELKITFCGLQLSLTCIGFNVYRALVVDKTLLALINRRDDFPNFEGLSFVQVRFGEVGAVLVFFAWIKVVKINYLPT